MIRSMLNNSLFKVEKDKNVRFCSFGRKIFEGQVTAIDSCSNFLTTWMIFFIDYLLMFEILWVSVDQNHVYLSAVYGRGGLTKNNSNYNVITLTTS